MEELHIKETQKTPKIILKNSGEFEISGNSFIENAQEFYEPIIKWLDNYLMQPAEITVLNFNFNYYNTSSQLWIYRIIEVLVDLKKLGKQLIVNWNYSEEEVEEAGQDLANLLNIEMNFIYKPQ